MRLAAGLRWGSYSAPINLLAVIRGREGSWGTERVGDGEGGEGGGRKGREEQGGMRRVE